MKVLIIGGTGVISTSVTELCIENGLDVFLLNRGGNKKYAGNAKYIISDVNNKGQTQTAISGMFFDVVIDFIAYTPQQLSQSLEIFSDKCKQFIFISSCGVFKAKNGEILKEDSEKNINSNWEYVTNKIKCEDVIKSYYNNKQNFFTIVRPHHTYNNYSFPAFIPSPTPTILTRIYNDKPTIMWESGKNSKISITHAEDFAKGLYGLLCNEKAYNQDFNIVNTEIITWDEALRIIYKKCKKNPLIAYFDETLLEENLYNIQGTITSDKKYDHTFDISKLQEAVPNYAPQITFEQGVAMVVENNTHKTPFISILHDTAIDKLLQVYQFEGRAFLKDENLNCIKKVKGVSFTTKLKYFIEMRN